MKVFFGNEKMPIDLLGFLVAIIDPGGIKFFREFSQLLMPSKVFSRVLKPQLQMTGMIFILTFSG